MNVYEKLTQIQSKLKAPKNQYNSFGKYNYRSCEDILEGLKPLLSEVKATVVLNDEIIQIGDRYYLKATAKFIDCNSGESVEASSLAREDETKKGMDLAQVTGSVSSYARKYALNGLFAIDDTKDSDSTNVHDKEPKKEPVNSENKVGSLSQAQIKRLYAIAYQLGYDKAKIETMVSGKYNKEIKDLSKQEYDHICNSLQSKVDEKEII